MLIARALGLGLGTHVFSLAQGRSIASNVALALSLRQFASETTQYTQYVYVYREKDLCACIYVHIYHMSSRQNVFRIVLRELLQCYRHRLKCEDIDLKILNHNSHIIS